MDSLLERIEENRLDALYLFINENLRDRQAFSLFFQNLVSVLPHNWSIQRVEVGHEFLGMVPNQQQLFSLLADLDSMRTLIISDGYVQRKDKGTISTTALLGALPNARNLSTLDIQRLELEDDSQVESLASVVELMQDSLEEVRITGLFVNPCIETLDPLAEAFVGTGTVKSLALSMHETCKRNKCLISTRLLKDLCQNSTSLQDLTLRAMHLSDQQCQTIASALTSTSFLTSLDVRQNPLIGSEGYSGILEALERNYDLWCAVMVDEERFQGKFNALIELNQAGRGDLLRNFNAEKFAEFIERLRDKSAIWYFLCIHESIREPLVAFLLYKAKYLKHVAAANTRKHVIASVGDDGAVLKKARACDATAGVGDA